MPEESASRWVAKKFMFRPPIFTVTCATDRVLLKYFKLLLEKAYFERIRFPSEIPGALAEKCQFHVRPVFCCRRLRRVLMSSGGISQKPPRSGLKFAIQVAIRFQLVTPSVPVPKLTFQLNTRNCDVVGGGGAGEVTLICTVSLAVAPLLWVTVSLAVYEPAEEYVCDGTAAVEVVLSPKFQAYDAM